MGVTPEGSAPRHCFPESGPVFGVSVGHRGDDQSRRMPPAPIHPVFVAALSLLLRNAPHRPSTVDIADASVYDTLYVCAYIHIYPETFAGERRRQKIVFLETCRGAACITRPTRRIHFRNDFAFMTIGEPGAKSRWKQKGRRRNFDFGARRPGMERNAERDISSIYNNCM